MFPSRYQIKHQIFHGKWNGEISIDCGRIILIYFFSNHPSTHSSYQGQWGRPQERGFLRLIGFLRSGALLRTQSAKELAQGSWKKSFDPFLLPLGPEPESFGSAQLSVAACTLGTAAAALHTASLTEWARVLAAPSGTGTWVHALQVSMPRDFSEVDDELIGVHPDAARLLQGRWGRRQPASWCWQGAGGAGPGALTAPRVRHEIAPPSLDLGAFLERAVPPLLLLLLLLLLLQRSSPEPEGYRFGVRDLGRLAGGHLGKCLRGHFVLRCWRPTSRDAVGAGATPVPGLSKVG